MLFRRRGAFPGWVRAYSAPENDAGKSTMDGPLPFGGNSVPGLLVYMRNPR